MERWLGKFKEEVAMTSLVWDMIFGETYSKKYFFGRSILGKKNQKVIISNKLMNSTMNGKYERCQKKKSFTLPINHPSVPVKTRK